MEEIKRVPSDKMPDFGEFTHQGISLEVLNNGRWEPFQPFYFDWMLDKEQKYYVKSVDDLKGYELMGKIQMSRNSDCILWVTYDMLRVRVD